MGVSAFPQTGKILKLNGFRPEDDMRASGGSEVPTSPDFDGLSHYPDGKRHKLAAAVMRAEAILAFNLDEGMRRDPVLQHLGDERRRAVGGLFDLDAGLAEIHQMAREPQPELGEQ